MPTDPRRDRDLRIRVNPTERAHLDRAAERFGLGTSTLVRLLINQMVERGVALEVKPLPKR